MADDDNGSDERVWPDEFRRFLRRLDLSRSLPGEVVVPRLSPGPVLADETAGTREPVADVIEGLGAVYVTIEVPGIAAEDIDLRATETTLVLTANTPARKYYREIPLLVPVLIGSVRATCRNGVLDVTLERKPEARRVSGA
jgi:HSP20 family molecular chaperone IbpA